MTRCAMDLFGAYQRDQYADPSSFAAQALLVFERYELAVIEFLTDPRNGDALQHRHPRFPPTVGELRAACEDRAVALARLREPKPKLISRPYVPPRTDPGCRANVLVHRDASGYDAVEAVVASGELDEADWARDPAGIRIGLHVWQTLGVRRYALKEFKPLSDDELRAHYGRLEADAAKARQGETAP